jgi:hypothetical protein
MRQRFSLFFFCVLATMVAVSTAGAADTGTIEGLIVDAETGDAALGVNVMLQGTPLGASTDLDGHYRVANVPAGSYTLTVTALGYSKLTVQNVLVGAGQTQTMNFQMHSAALQLNEVVIEARQVNNTEAALLGIQKRAPTVSDGISAEQIKKSPDSDASGAVKRITGVTVIGGKYIYVRGMGERYNTTRLDGSALASPEPLKRTVPLDIIPSNFLDNVIVSKTATPDQPADFAGGSVQLSTVDFPEKLILSATASGSYNTQASLKDFNSYSGGNKDWLAVDDGTRSIPGYVLNTAFWNSDQQSRQAAQSFRSYAFSPAKMTAPFNGSRSLALGNRTEWLGKPVGYLLSLNYSDSYSRFSGESNDYIAQTNGNYDPRQRLTVDRSDHTVGWGGIFDLSTRLSDNHKISLKNLYTRSADDEVRIIQGEIRANTYHGYRLSWTERSLLSSQLKGAHELPSLLGSRLDWTGSYSRGTYDQPDRREVNYVLNEGDNLYYFLGGGLGNGGVRRFANMRDNTYEGTLDWSLPLSFVNMPGSHLKFGGLYRSLDRTFPTRTFYLAEVTEPDQPQLDRTLPPEAIFSPLSLEHNFVLEVLQANLDSYNAQTKVGAGYAMGDFLLANRWRMVGGVRVEDTDQHYKTFPYLGSSDAEFSEGGPKHTDVLPSINVTYKVNEKLNLRAAGSMTIANPDYAEVVPTRDQEFAQGRERVGNPNIKHSKIANFDLRSDYYPSIGENLALGVFYKDIRDPIEWVLENGTNGPELIPDNFAHAHNLGVEFEFRKSLSLLAPTVGDWISMFSLLGNVAYVSSRVDLTTAGQNVLTNKHRPLVEQSPYVANATLAYDHPHWNTSVRLLLNTFGKRISAVGAQGVDDTYEMPFAKMDLTLNQRLDSRWSVKLQGINLLNSSVEFQSRSFIVQKYKIGRTYSMQFAYSI